MIGILARLGAGGFEAAHREYLERIGVHLREALDIHQHVRALAIGHAVGLDLIERLGKPAWVIDERLEVAGMNRLAHASLERGGPLREIAGRLGPAAPDLLNAFAAVVRDLVKRSDRGETSPRGYLRLGRPGAVASVALFEPQATMHAFGDRRHLLVMLHETDAAPEPDIYLWQIAFDLTPAEARACRQVYDGMTLKQAADVLGISANTVNTQIDSAYSKVGVNNKVDLVQRLRSLG
jgi:DNA-binding CsgD family transcriptional regulator